MKWISVKEMLPEKDSAYIVCISTLDENKPLIQMSWYDPNGFGWSLLQKCFIDSITHWMSLPELPTNN